MQGKKWIAAALVCGFLLGQGTAPAQAGILGTVVKGGAVSLLVSQFADQLNSAIRGADIAHLHVRNSISMQPVLPPNGHQ